MRDLTLTGLRVLLEVSWHGSFTAASEHLGYTQSAVSRQVGAAEAAVGAALFERGPRGVTPTPAGDVVLRHARRVVDALDAAELEVAGLVDRVAGRLVVGAFPVAAAWWVPQAVRRVQLVHPALVVDLREAGSPTQLRLLRAGRIEVALLARGEGLPEHDLSDLRAEHLARGRVGVVVAGSHPLAARAEVDPDELADEPWVVGTGPDPQFLAWPTLVEPRVAYRVQSWQTRLGLVAAGLAVSLLPESAAGTVPRGVVWVPVAGPPPVDRESLVVTRPDRGPAAASYVRALHEVAAERRTSEASGARPVR